MKHIIELKFPKVFKRKQKVEKPVEEADVKTEIDLGELTAEIDFEKLKAKAIQVGIPVAIGVSGLYVGYLMGHKAGTENVLNTTVMVIE